MIKPDSNFKQNGSSSSKNDFASNEALIKHHSSGSENVKPLASISLDLDNQWSYMKTHGDAGWESFPSYLNILIPMVLDILDELNLKITFFIVGRDASLEKNQDSLKLLTERGHEVGNHSFNHEPWLHLYPKDQIRREIIDTDEHIQRVTGQKPIGFRGPGFSWSADLLEVLSENNYLFDASTLPTYIGPLARAYYFWTSNLTDNEKSQRKKLFGSFKEGLHPVKPYYVRLRSGSKLLEIPVTTTPILKIPFHLSYLIYLSRYSELIMISYLKTVLTLCMLTRTAPSFLLHPLDFLSGVETPELSFFPGMTLSSENKTAIFCKVLKILSSRFNLVNMSTHAKSTLDKNLQEKIY